MAQLGLIQRFGAWLARAPEQKRAVYPDEWIESTVTPADASVSQYRATGIDQYVNRCVSVVRVCVHLNAQAVASTPFRLYRKAKGSGNGRKVGRKRMRWLTNPMPGFGPGHKAALRAESAGEVEEVLTHPILDTLRAYGFAGWELHHSQKEICGNAYAYVDDDRSLTNMRPQWVTIEASRETFIRAYWYGRTRDIARAIDPERVVHEKFEESLHQPFYGSCPLEGFVDIHDARQSMNQYTTALFNNMARPDVVFTYKNALGEDQLKREYASLAKLFRGVKNAARFAIAHGDMSIGSLGQSARDLEYATGRKLLASEIASAFGVPETFLYPNDGSLSQLRNAMVLHGRYAVLPRCVKHAEWLTTALLGDVFEEDGMWFACDNPVPEDELAETQAIRQMTDGGLVTLNEGREDRGYATSDDEAANVLRFNGQRLDAMVGAVAPAVGDTPAAPAEPAATGGAAVQDTALNGAQLASARELLAAVAAGELPLESALALFAAAFPLVTAEQVSAIFGPLANFEPATPEPAPPPEPPNQPDPPADPSEPDKGHAHPKAVKQSAIWTRSAPEPGDPYSEPIQTAVEQFFKLQRDAIMAAAKAAPMGFQPGGPKHGRKDATSAEVERLMLAWGVTDYERWTKQLFEMVDGPVDDELAKAAVLGAQGLQSMGAALEKLPAEFAKIDQFGKAARRFIDGNTAALLDGLDGVNRTTADAIARTLSEGVAAGETSDMLRKRVAEAYDAESETGEPISRVRARTIARTEAGRAQTNGQLASFAESEVVAGKTWLLSPNSCEFCRAAAVKHGDNPIPLAQPFYNLGETVIGATGGIYSVDFAPVMGGDLHPNDKCGILPVLR